MMVYGKGVEQGSVASTEAEERREHAYWLSTLAAQLKILNPGVEVEKRLPNGRVADIWVPGLARVSIIEVKTIYKPSYFRDAARKYWSQCNYLWLAVPTGVIPWWDGCMSPLSWRGEGEGVGLVAVNGFTFTFRRSAQEH